MKKLVCKITMAALLVVAATSVYGQCETWVNSPQKDALEEAHVLYRQFVKSEEFEKAFPYWEKVYKAAPAADGQRASHYVDGRAIYMDRYKKETDPAKKKEHEATILRLYDEQVKCYPKESALTLGLKVYDMFYVFNSMYSDNLQAADAAVKAGGNNTSYVVFQPYASMAVYQFQNKLMTAEEVRNIHTKLNEIADFNIANNKTYADTYKQAKDAMNGTFAPIEGEIFDCAYFKTKLEPDYRAHPDDTEVIKYVYNKLVNQGCTEEDALVAELKKRYEEIVAAENAARLAEHYKENPGDHGVALFKEEKYTEALQKFQEGIEKEQAGGKDGEKLGNYYFYMASIEFRQLSRMGAAREHARTAAKYRPGWGQPYMLIGDMYASSSSSCGADELQRGLAVIAAMDKYGYAKSIDGDVASEASRKIGIYSAHLPSREMAFLQGVKEGESKTVPCWIGETVKVRFRD